MSEQTATKYTVLNLKEVDNQGSNFGIPEDSYTFRMARVPLGCENSGVSHVWMAPGYRQPFGHKHKRQEEIYVLVNGNMRAKLDEDIVELKPWDAVRIAKDTMRAPDAHLVYGTKAFPNVAILRLLGGLGVGADVASLGELRFAQAAGIPGDQIVVHGNEKSDAELKAGADAGALVVLDAPDEVERAVVAGVRRVLVRVTPGIEAGTHEAIRTAHHGAKVGLPPGDSVDAVSRAREAGLEPDGVHIHIGSQLLDMGAALETVDWLGPFVTRARDELGWEPAVVDLGGG